MTTTFRYLKLFRWHFRLFDPYGPDALVWRKDGVEGITVSQLGGWTLLGRKRSAKLVHLDITVVDGRVGGGATYNARYSEAHMHTAQFHLESDSPIAYASFSWWRPDSP